MLDFDEEIKKFHPSLEVEEAEDAIYKYNSKDMTEIMMEMLEEMKEIERQQGR